jgi:hypothetical protein
VALLLTALALGSILHVAVLVMLSMFLKFHLELLFSNLTTIEILELQRAVGKDSPPDSPFDIGPQYNFQQVFGRNKLTWPLPFFLEGEGPVGDGVLWPKLQ